MGRHALLWCAAHSVTHYMCAPSFAPSTPRLPKNILRSLFLSSDEKKQPSFSPLLFVISAEGGNYRQGWRVVRRSRMREPNTPSEAGIQLKYASGVAGHNRRLRRRNNAASKRLCHATRDDISIAGSPPTGEDDGLGDFCKNDELSSGTAGQLYSRAAEQDARAERSGVAGHNRGGVAK